MNDAENESGGIEEGIDEALEGQPRAAELRRMAYALEQRRSHLVADLDAMESEEDCERVRRQIAVLDEQVQTLLEEAAISHFVSDTVRFSKQVRDLGEG
jgi:hypothetical protein